MLAQMGYAVTAVDISERFLGLVTTRAAQVGAHIETLRGDFSMVHELDRQFDSVLFFECFHHCPNHVELVEGLDRVVAPGGQIVFGAEPIQPMEVPWGLRNDGESVFQIRKRGWFELGFRPDYFLELLERYGWQAQRYSCTDLTPWGDVFIARRRNGE